MSPNHRNAHLDMGLYDDRLADLSEPRRGRVARSGRNPMLRREPPLSEASRKSMEVESLLFSRDDSWTPSKAKAWAQAHGYRYGKVDITDQYIRIRQFSPKGSKVKRTIPFGRGIRAVVAREEMKSMATTREAPRHRRSKKKEEAPKRRRRPAAKKRVHHRRAKAAAKETPRRRRHKSHVMEASKRRRSAPKRRAKRRVEAWHGHKKAHATAARKGWRKRKHSKRVVHRTREASATVATPKRRRRHVRHNSQVMETPRRRHHSRHRSSEASRGGSGMGIAEMGLALLGGGIGFVIADGVDRLLATYNPSEATPPNDKFTSDGAGTLANSLNVASRPGLLRLGVGLGVPVLAGVGTMFVDEPLMKSALMGSTIGSGASFFKTLWNNLVMPLLAPKANDTAALKTSYIARLYPAEVSAHLNKTQTPALTNATGTAFGALSDKPDVGPFALGGPDEYPNAAEALQHNAGMAGPGATYPTVQKVWGTGAPQQRYEAPPAHAAVVEQWRAAHPAYQGAGGQAQQWSNLWAQQEAQAPQWNQYWNKYWGNQPTTQPTVPGPTGYWMRDEQIAQQQAAAQQQQYPTSVTPTHHHHHCMARAKVMYPYASDAALFQFCESYPPNKYPYLYEAPVASTGLSAPGDAPPPPPPPPAPGSGNTSRGATARSLGGSPGRNGTGNGTDAGGSSRAGASRRFASAAAGLDGSASGASATCASTARTAHVPSWPRISAGSRTARFEAVGVFVPR